MGLSSLAWMGLASVFLALLPLSWQQRLPSMRFGANASIPAE